MPRKGFEKCFALTACVRMCREPSITKWQQPEKQNQTYKANKPATALPPPWSQKSAFVAVFVQTAECTWNPRAVTAVREGQKIPWWRTKGLVWGSCVCRSHKGVTPRVFSQCHLLNVTKRQFLSNLGSCFLRHSSAVAVPVSSRRWQPALFSAILFILHARTI